MVIPCMKYLFSTLLGLSLCSVGYKILGIPDDKNAFMAHIDPNLRQYGNMYEPKDAVERYGEHLAGYGLFVTIEDSGGRHFYSTIYGFNEKLPPNAVLIISAMPQSWEHFDQHPDLIDNIAGICADLNHRLGRRIILRFAHEMNGDWYKYGGRANPWRIGKFKEYFAKLADLVHQKAKLTAMMWAPATMTESYWDYWPGDDKVDAVGLSTYYFGNPGHSSPPSRGLLKNWLNEQNFFYSFVERPQKFFCAAEIGIALYHDIDGDYDKRRDYRQAWWDQIVDEMNTRSRFKCVIYFDISKYEGTPSIKHDFSISNYDKQWSIINYIKYRMAMAKDLI